MDVRILNILTGELVEGRIISGRKLALPSVISGWRFNFDKHSKKLVNSETYVLVSGETPSIIEGCLIFQMIDGQVPYMTFIEVAPHNRGYAKKYDYVAGCLISFAFRLSVIKGKGV